MVHPLMPYNRSETEAEGAESNRPPAFEKRCFHFSTQSKKKKTEQKNLEIVAFVLCRKSYSHFQ